MSLRGELFRAQCARNGNKRHRPKQSKCEIASLTLAMTKRESDCFTEYIDRWGFQTPHPVAGQACPEFNEGNVPPIRCRLRECVRNDNTALWKPCSNLQGILKLK